MSDPLIKRINPFGPLSGRVWRGPDCNEKFIYNYRHWAFYKIVDGATVKQIIESNGKSYDDFKTFYKSHCGSPKRVPKGYGPNPTYTWCYLTEYVWDYCFKHGFGEYPFPRVNANNEVVYE